MPSERIQRRIDRLLDQIEESADQEDWETTLRLSEQVLDLDPDDKDAQTFLRLAQRRVNPESVSVTATPESAVSSPLTSTSPVKDQPTAFADGRYQVQRFLGEGGKKMVYLAQDTLLDRQVAFALIKTDGLDAISRTRISREAQAMGRLGSHPHIVTVFDLGDHEGQPFMVAELMGGGDVEGILEDAEGGKLPMEQAVSIAVETCRGLEFAHSKGIVHRDLKPGNVWLTADGTAKIGDFGLAVATDRSRLTAEGMMVGTVSYMPPEQAMGGEVTPKADLYSLGAMLYEMVCGRPPFLGDDNIAIIGQHINTPPVAPTWHRSDCPRPLEALIMRLLAKNPSERPDSASDVLAALESIDPSPSEQSITEPEQAANVLDSLAGDVFVGRKREMDDLKAALEDALGGRGRMVTLVGEPGIGKTRTAQELATYAGLRGAQVLWGRCYEEQGVPSYWPWVQAIRAYVRDTKPEKLRSEMGSGAADIAEIVSDVRVQLPDLKPSSVLENPDQERFRLFDSITAFLKTASQRQPIMLVLDDLHWSDSPSLTLLQFIARELSGSRLLLVGTYRDVELSRQHPLAETLGELMRERLFERVVLRGLSREDVARFIEVTSGIVPPESLVQSVYTQTEGNPLFVTEVVRLLVQEGELTAERARERDSWELRVPEGVREVIGRRLNRLSERCNETLTVASVIGREFTLDHLDGLIEDMNYDMVLDVLEEGLTARVIEELPSAMGHYQFTHALVQETLVDELSLTRRVRLHARIAETLEAMYGADVESNAAELAHHFAQAEAMLGSEKLVRYSLIAGNRALANYGWEDALVHFERALAGKEHLPVDDETAEILLGLSRAQTGTLSSWEAFVNRRRAFDYYVSHGQVNRAIATAGDAMGYAGPELGEFLEAVLELVEPNSHEAGKLLSQYGFFLAVGERNYEEALITLERALSIARRERDVPLELWTLSRLGNTLNHVMRWRDALERLEDALPRARAIGELELEVYISGLAVMSSVVMGDPKALETHSSAAMTGALRLGNPIRLLFTLMVNIIARLATGEWALARDLLNQVPSTQLHRQTVMSFRVLFAYQSGDADSGRTALDNLSDHFSTSIRTQTIGPVHGSATGGSMGFMLPLVSYMVGDNSTLDVAYSYARNLQQTVTEKAITGSSLDVEAEMTLGLIGVLRGEISDLPKHYEAVKPHAGVYFGFVSIDRLLGIFARALSRLDTAQAHFDDALTFCRKAGYRPELAWSLHDYADMLLERNGPGDRQKATAMLDEALQMSTDLGMRPLMERVLSKRDILKA